MDLTQADIARLQSSGATFAAIGMLFRECRSDVYSIRQGPSDESEIKACEKAARTMPRVRGIAAGIVLSLVGIAAFGSPPEPCSLTSAVADAKVGVAISNGRTSFREGEIIPLVLSFTSTAVKRYWADNRNYDRSGRLNIETYCVEPAVRDPLEDYFRAGAFMGGGLGSTQQLSEKAFTATAELNEWRQPGPGHYRLYVVSHRVWRPPDPNESTPNGRVEMRLRSNAIEFDVTKADPDCLGFSEFSTLPIADMQLVLALALHLKRSQRRADAWES